VRVILVGATGTIGRAVLAALAPPHDIIPVSASRSSHTVDLADPDSIARMYRVIGPVDGVVCTAGLARFGPLASLSDADFELSLRNKLMGQVNLVRRGVEAVADRGSFTLTSGVLAQRPSPGSAAISLVNAGLEGFVRAAALELPRGIRINVVSPPWVSETLAALKLGPSGGLPAAVVARSYVAALEGRSTGQVLAP
jgi:NAD(P)-dependent dehydrogenase (short-subunit alcohol dehydrogenase family)